MDGIGRKGRDVGRVGIEVRKLRDVKRRTKLEGSLEEDERESRKGEREGKGREEGESSKDGREGIFEKKGREGSRLGKDFFVDIL